MSTMITNKQDWNKTTDKFAQVYFLEQELALSHGTKLSDSKLIDMLNLFPSRWMKPIDSITLKNVIYEFDQDTMDQFRFTLNLVYDLPNMYTVMQGKKTYKLYNPDSFSYLYNDGTTRYPNRIINMGMIKDILNNVPIIYNEDGSTTDDINDDYVVQYISIQNEIIKEALPDLFETIYMIPQIDGINRSGLSGITNIQDINICIGEKFDTFGRVTRQYLNLDKILTLADVYEYYLATNTANVDLIMFNIISEFSANIYAKEKFNMPKYIVTTINKIMEVIKMIINEDFLRKPYLDKQIDVLRMIK